MRQDQIKNTYNECRQLTQILWVLQYGRISTSPCDPLKQELVRILTELERLFYPDVAYVKRSEALGPQHVGLFVCRQKPSIVLHQLLRKELFTRVIRTSATGALFATSPNVTRNDLLEHVNQPLIMSALTDLELKNSLIDFFKHYFNAAFRYAEVTTWMNGTFGCEFTLPSHVSVVALADEDLMDYASDLLPDEANAVRCLASMSA